MNPEWARSLRDQCEYAGVPFFFKQWGEWCPGHPSDPKIKQHVFSPGEIVGRFGKKACGRKLDGREHGEFPDGW
jgi:protein gp37